MNLINRGTFVLLNDVDKGENMKKAFAIFITVCMIASLFVACDNTTKLNELVSTRFDAAGSRSLIVSNENFIGFNDSTIKWQYKAVKVTDTSYNVGAASDWTDIPGTTPGLLSNTIEFSQGKWNFELRAVKVDTDGNIILDENNNPACVVYYGKTEAPVLLEKQTSTNPQSIVINLTAQLSDQKGYIVLNNVSIKHANGTDVFDAPSKVVIDAGTTNEKVLTSGTDYSITGTSISTLGEGYEISVGTHTVKVQKIGANNEILAEEEKTIEVYAGLKTTISNWVLEITQMGQFVPVAPTGTKSGNVSSADSDGNLALIVENVTPSMVSGNSTTVTVPTSVLGSSATTATVSVAVKQASEASTDNSFTASTGNAVAAVIDLTLSAGSTTVTDFSSPVKVETYVAKNLDGFSFGYPGETWTKKESLAEVAVARDYYYDSGEGKLTFLTDHFSSFVVETSSVAVVGDTAYNTLQEAINACEANSTVALLKDITGDKISISNSLSIDGNGYTLTDNNSDGRAIWIDDTDVTLTINDLTIDGKNKCQRGLQVNYIENGWINAKIVLNNCTIKNITHYAINLCSNTTVDMEINNSYISGWAAINAYGTGNTITVNKSILEGINDKDYNADGWNNFATICLEGDTTGHTTLGSSDYQVTINDSTIKASQTKGNKQRAIGFNSNSKNSTVSLNNTEITLGDDELCTFAYDNGKLNQIYIDNVLVHENNCWYSNNAFNANREGGIYTNLVSPFEGGWLASGEGIILDKDISLDGNITCQMTEGSFYLYLDNHTISGGKIILNSGVSVISDTAGISSIFGGGSITENANEDGTYTYTCMQQ